MGDFPAIPLSALVLGFLFSVSGLAAAQRQIDKRFGSVNSVNYSNPNVQPQPR